MSELDDAFGINAITLDGETGSVNLIAGSVDPSSGIGIVAPVNTHYFRSNGEHWVKSGIGATAWAERTSSTSSSLADGLAGVILKAVDFSFDGSAVVVEVDTTIIAVIATLPLAALFANKIFIIKWSAGIRANKVSLKAQVGELIDGVNCQILGEIEDALTVISNGTNWILI